MLHEEKGKTDKTQIVILGGGFAGVETARYLDRTAAKRADVEFVDLHLPEHEGQSRFTFFWLDDNRWEGNDYTVELKARADSRTRKAPYGEPASLVA